MSQLLHNDCERMLRQPINKIIVCEVLEKLSQTEKKHTIFIDVSKEKMKEKNNLYKLVLTIFGCNKY
jgi:hypothetical protein